MPDVIGIRFKSCGKAYDFEVNGIEVKEGDYVVVESDFGLSLGRVVIGRRFIEKSERELKRVVRVATDDDFSTKEENRKLEKEARDFCMERIMARGLPMKLVATEATLDRKRIIFYFTAEGRIDFRELVKDLAARFKTRIEMRQIGVRDEAKFLGGIGVCGRTLCCNTFLTSFEPVSIKMAKKQEMVLNIGKLSGLCNRLMCCMRYEYDGDLGTIVADDELPPETEEAPVEKFTETFSMSLVTDKKAGAAPSISEQPAKLTTKQAVQPGPAVPAAEAASSRQEGVPEGRKDREHGQEHKKKRRRFKRRRFKK